MTTYSLPRDNMGSLTVCDDGTQEFTVGKSTFLAILKKLHPLMNTFVFPWQNKFKVIVGIRWFNCLLNYHYTFDIKFSFNGNDNTACYYVYGLKVIFRLTNLNRTRYSNLVTIILPASMRGKYYDNIIRKVVGLPASE
jgi:hypothetical protein